MFLRARGAIREVDAEVVSPAELALMSPPTPALEHTAEPEVPAAPQHPAPPQSRHGRPRRTHHRPARREQATHAPEPETEPTPAEPAQTCEIVYWRGYVKGTFYARIFAANGEPLAVAESPSFRPQGNGIPERTDEAAAALEALRRQLEAGGWERHAAGHAWFNGVYRRRS